MGANALNNDYIDDGTITIDNVTYNISEFDKTEGVSLVAPDGTVFDDGYEYGVYVGGSQ